MRTIEYTAQPKDAGRTVGQLLHARLHVSERYLRHARHIEGAVLLDGALSRCDAQVAAGQVVGIVVDDWLEPHEPGVAPERGPLEVAFEDDDLLVVNKPAGCVVHPCPGHWEHTLGNYVVGYLMARRESIDLHPVNRLDIGTSGLVVFAKNGHVQELLKGQMHTGSFRREYLAVCEGVPEPATGAVDAPIGRATSAPVSSFAVMEDGKPAVTHYAVVERLEGRGEDAGMSARRGGADRHESATEGAGTTPTGADDWRKRAAPKGAVESIPGDAGATAGANGGERGDAALVRLVLETGRTHQIRVHMAHVGCPLVGDALYGGTTDLLARPALHSWKLDLVQPVTGKDVHLEVPPPEDFVQLVRRLR